MAQLLASEGAPSAPARVASDIWANLAARRVCRPLRIPSEARIVAVGGATLGGSGKTVTAIAIARALSESGERVAFVGHAYRAKPRAARVVQTSDDVRAVGDEALWATRELAGSGVPVVVAPSRQLAVDYAAQRGAAWIVIDGVLQTAPQRAHRSILVLDRDQPWGSGRCPPAGDLRAPRVALLDAADAVAWVHDAALPRQAATSAESNGIGSRLPHFELSTTQTDPRDGSGARIRLRDLTTQRVGVVFAIARPGRVLRGLTARGITPCVCWLFVDHAHPSASELERSARAMGAAAPRFWLTTGKCATKLPSQIAGAPVLVLEHALGLPPALISWLVSDCASPLFPAATSVVDCAPCELPAGK